jgi:alpha,alpha-trehalase
MRGTKWKLYPVVLALISASLACSGAIPARPQQAPAEATAPSGLQPILEYISNGWDTLTRSMGDCSTIVDSKLAAKSILYVPANFEIPASVKDLETKCGVEVKPLPKVIHKLGEIDTNTFYPHGVLYLPQPYVVPGGRFNEMYGWDSYFIIRGLVRAGKIDLARGMVENFFFEIENYGAVLNANRTYYLSRSQPPFLTSMILSIYDAQKANGKEDRAWLERAYGYAARDHAMWIQEPMLAGNTGLSRYFDFGEGPAPESLKDETDHYKKVAEYFLAHPETGHVYLVERKPGEKTPLGPGNAYSLQFCDIPRTMERPNCEVLEEVSLSREYYKGDRSMRESGFDISFRFSPYGADTHHFAPVCLNSLLYKTETDLEQMARMLGKKAEGEEWRKQAAARKEAIQKYLWNAEKGQYFDFNFVTQKMSSYEYASTFYPLWAGLASKEQAAAVVKTLSHFERPGGVMMSPYDTGMQWDEPFAWAPVQLVDIEGLRRYGYATEANRASYEFLSTVAENFRKDGTIREKYNAIDRSTDATVKGGYQINVVGFGWTNGVFLVFLNELPAEMVEKLGKEQAGLKAAAN